jgi:hypothetical protein
MPGMPESFVVVPVVTPPHTPLTTGWEAATGAEQEAVEPLLAPAQDQLQGPEPVTPEVVPAEHRLAVGALATATPFAAPHAPFAGCGMFEACADVHGALPDTGAHALPLQYKRVWAV